MVLADAGHGEFEIYDEQNPELEKTLTQFMDTGFSSLCNFSFQYDPKCIHWFLPKNQSFFFVPWEISTKFYFKAKLNAPTKV